MDINEIQEYNKKNDIQGFKEALFDNFGVKDNPKKDLCWSLAWDYGHAYGLVEVYNYFDDLVDLIKK